MRIESVRDNKICVEIPLTTQSGKIRVKIRNSFYEYGILTATRQRLKIFAHFYKNLKTMIS
ncbi:hypothetical protein [Helicobacter aurati]|uniref:hypothetical protein n=1 Tax=Helicobacter aurati TaxID=137778 RepID=UPI001F3EC108|nr:hypothetical protein [Helicobacter aurati]